MESFKEILIKFFERESESEIARIASTNLCDYDIKNLSKDDFFNDLVELCNSHTNKITELEFEQRHTKYDEIIAKFDEHCAKKSPPNDFALESVKLEFIKMKMAEEEKGIPVSKDVKKILANSWEGKENIEADINTFKEIIKIQKGRESFIDALNQYKKSGLLLMKEAGYKNILKLIYLLMDQIEKDNDIGTALNMVLLSQVFYMDPGSAKSLEAKGKRIFIQLEMKRHSFWQNNILWERAITMCLKTEEIEKLPENEKKQVILEKLNAFIENMLHFEISPDSVQEIIIHCAKSYGLPIDKLKVLRFI